jgi:hypothetical protein
VVTRGKIEIMKLIRVRRMRLVQAQKCYVKNINALKCGTKCLSLGFTDTDIDGEEKRKC